MDKWPEGISEALAEVVALAMRLHIRTLGMLTAITGRQLEAELEERNFPEGLAGIVTERLQGLYSEILVKTLALYPSLPPLSCLPRTERLLLKILALPTTPNPPSTLPSLVPHLLSSTNTPPKLLPSLSRLARLHP